MSRINQPINQVRLTNVAIVRMNRSGKRFEIACYRNKVVNYRQGLETDLSEVLQTDRIFVNVSKGQFAKASDLEEVFGTRNEEDIAKMILDKGTVQIGDLERSHQLENTMREVATWVAENCVHPTSQRPYTVTQIREAMKEAEFATHPTKSIKRQYLDCVKLLQTKQVLPIERAKMELALFYPVDQESILQQKLQDANAVPTQTINLVDECQLTFLVDPSMYRPLDIVAKDVGGRLEILRQVVRQEGDTNLEVEMERKKQSAMDETANEDRDKLVTALNRKLLIDDEPKAHVETKSNVIHIDDDDDDDKDGGGDSSRKNQKRAQKKSKKAQRREKEEVAERKARIDLEKQRQEERAVTLGGSNVEGGDPQGGENDAKSCNTCGGSFATGMLYRAHFRSDWHRYNLKLKMKGIVPVSEQEFLLCDSDAFFEDMA